MISWNWSQLESNDDELGIFVVLNVGQVYCKGGK